MNKKLINLIETTPDEAIPEMEKLLTNTLRGNYGKLQNARIGIKKDYDGNRILALLVTVTHRKPFKPTVTRNHVIAEFWGNEVFIDDYENRNSSRSEDWLKLINSIIDELDLVNKHDNVFKFKTIKENKMKKTELKRLIEEVLQEVKEEQKYIVTAETSGGYFGGRTREYKSDPLTLPELIKYYSYTLKVGKDYEREKGNKKINLNPRTIDQLITNLYNAKNNAARDGYSGYTYSYEKVINEARTDQIVHLPNPADWLVYEKDPTNIGDKSWEKHLTNINKLNDYIQEAIDEWNEEADEPINTKKTDRDNVSLIKALASDFFEKYGWININIIHAMIFQNWN